MPLDIGTPEEKIARDRCYQASDIVFFSIRGNQTTLGTALLTVGSVTADQNYFIEGISLAGCARPSAAGSLGYVVLTVCRDVPNEGDVMGGIALPPMLGRLASIIVPADGNGGGVAQDFKFHPYGHYFRQGEILNFSAASILDAGAGISWIGDAILRCVPMFK